VKIRRHLHAVLALMLPLMLLRGLLPPGYMVATDGELRIVMCSAGLAAQPDTGIPADHSQSPDTGSCLFAHAAGFAPPSAAPCCQLAPPALSFDVPVLAQRPLATGPYRFAAARGPPRYS